MTLEADIAWWTNRGLRAMTDASLVAFGVATGLKIAKADYGAADMKETIEHLRRELFSLCEDTEERYAEVAGRDLEGKEGAFARGRIKEAKSIRNAMGDIFREALSATERDNNG